MSDVTRPAAQDSRSEGIDVLRCVFALYVLVLSHLAFWAPVIQEDDSAGWLTIAAKFNIWLFQGRGELNAAVLGFIVLSGYCILRRGPIQRAAVPKFLIQRAFRILPIFTVATVVGVIAFLFAKSHFPDHLAPFGTSSIYLSCAAAKISTIAAILPIAHPCSYVGNAPLLTVMVEIDLYLFCAFAAFISRKFVLAICLAAFVAGMFIAATRPTSGDDNLYNWWQNSSFEAFLPIWWIGAIATFERGAEWIKRVTLPVVAAWLLLTIIENYFDPTAVSAEIRKYGTALLIARLVLASETWPRRFQLPAFIGRASYSVYALHAPLAILMLCFGFSWWMTATTIILIGIVSFYAIESPGIRLGKWLSRRSNSRRQLAPDFQSS